MKNHEQLIEEADQLSTTDQKLRDMTIPGLIVTFTPQEAEEAGAFEETGLTFEEAWASRFDGEEDDQDTEPDPDEPTGYLFGDVETQPRADA